LNGAAVARGPCFEGGTSTRKKTSTVHDDERDHVRAIAEAQGMSANDVDEKRRGSMKSGCGDARHQRT
jgi:hypothetical protein